MKTLVAVFLIVATLLMTVPAMAEFYVIPVPAKIQSSEVVSTFEVVSAYLSLDSGVNGTAYTIMTVPVGKRFILTDICDFYSKAFELAENDQVKMLVPLFDGGNYKQAINSLHLNTGIPFGPGTQVNLIVNFGYNTHRVTITGYLIDN